MAEVFSQKEKEELRSELTNEFSKFDWGHWENKLRQAYDKVNWEKLRLELAKLSPDAQVVIYCGCCPFNHCPNIRPAFNLMNEMKFERHKLLNLPKNIKVDWIDKGYPVN